MSFSIGADTQAPGNWATRGLPANTAPGETPRDFATMPPPLNVESVLWNLSTPAERQGLLARAEASPAGAAQSIPETCTIELRYTPVLGGIANHALVTTTDADSQNYYRGGPGAGEGSSGSSGSSSASSGGSSPGGSPYGYIATEHGPYRQGGTDYPAAHVQAVETRPGNCDAVDAAFARTTGAIEAARIYYRPLGPNSNSTARTILEGGGISPPEPNRWVPGWDTTLPLGR